jgi:hypothetical protein
VGAGGGHAPAPGGPSRCLLHRSGLRPCSRPIRCPGGDLVRRLSVAPCWMGAAMGVTGLPTTSSSSGSCGSVGTTRSATSLRLREPVGTSGSHGSMGAPATSSSSSGSMAASSRRSSPSRARSCAVVKRK